jgi:hypothetical protein
MNNRKPTNQTQVADDSWCSLSASRHLLPVSSGFAPFGLMMEYVKATRAEQNSLRLLEAIRQAFGGANNRREISVTPAHDVYEIRPRADRDGFDLISDRLRYGPIWYAGPDAVRCAVAYAKYCSRSCSRPAVIRVFNEGATSPGHTSDRVILKE